VDMRENMVYSGGYSEDHPVIERLWRVLSHFTTEQQRDFLMFVTSCSRPPLLGFKYLEPKMCVHRSVPDINTDDYLPTASTCMNFLKMPPYSSDQKMKEKLLYAISSKSGFELS